MSGIFQGDIIIKQCIELGIEDFKKNPWLVNHMYEDLTENPYLKQKYGQKQILACQEWLANNKIEFYMAHSKNLDKTPCITITMGNSPEKQDMKTMADQSSESVLLMPNTIGKPIPYVVKPFAPESYDINSGEMVIPADTKSTEKVSIGMILVDPSTGTGYGIVDIIPGGIKIESGTELKASTYGIVPQFQIYKARIEHTFFQESYVIGCHAHGDPQNLLWLWSITLYSLLRYRESLLEFSGFTESVFSNSDIQDDESYGGVSGEQVFKRYITLTGQVENSWIKSPRRFIENLAVAENTADGFIGGIKILSNENSPAFIDKTNETWYTANEETADFPSSDEEEE